MEKPIVERRKGARARVDLPARTYFEGSWRPCRAVDLSPSGVVVARPTGLPERALRATSSIEIGLPGAPPIRAHARGVWSRGDREALELVVVRDVDRLTIAELLDGLDRRGLRLH